MSEEFLTAIENNQIEAVINFLFNDSNILNYIDNNGNTPLHIAARSSLDNPTIVRLLIEFGLDDMGFNYEGNLALYEAVLNGNAQIAATLANLNNIDIVNFNGHTALHLAALIDNDVIFDILLACGANPYIANSQVIIAAQLTPNFHYTIERIANIEPPEPELDSKQGEDNQTHLIESIDQLLNNSNYEVYNQESLIFGSTHHWLSNIDKNL